MSQSRAVRLTLCPGEVYAPTSCRSETLPLDDDEFPTHFHRLPIADAVGVFAQAADAEQGDDPEKVTRFVLYSGKEVRYNPLWQQGGDVIATREISLKRYNRNPVVLLEHDQSLVIGRGKAKVENAGDVDALMFAVEWDLHPTNPTAILVAGQHARKMRNAVSLGFMPGKDSVSRADLPKKHPFFIETESKWSAGNYWRHSEMYEGSSVSIPKDPDALQVQSWAMSAEDPDERLRRVVTEVLDSKARELVLQAVRSDPAVRTAIEGVALGSIPSPAPPSSPAGWSWDEWS